VAGQKDIAPPFATLRRALLLWYRKNRRDLPWRKSRDPYAIWVSEIMLQQTRVAVVIERYQAFVERFPTLLALALAPEQEVLALWSGLGYYRRARMLHKAAQYVTETQHGTLPTTAAELRTLPGIGDYTAAAIASIAHGEPIAVVDGNVERVVCRLAGWEAPTKTQSTALRKRVAEFAQQMLDRPHVGDFNQAMMELGALVCTPRSPQCLTCPLRKHCKTRGEHKTAPRARMRSQEAGYALTVRTSTGYGKDGSRSRREVLLEQRPAEATVMPGLWELPPLRDPAVPESVLRLTVRHAIMQVNYYVRIRTVFEDDVERLAIEPAGERRWVPLDTAATMALTGLARKVLARTHLLPVPPLDTVAPGTP
jgi:A/G-specific adenine glycosylase